MNTRSRGHSLVELAAVLTTVGVALLIVAPTIERARDGLAVRGARDALAQALVHTRIHARMHGGAALYLDADAGSAVILSATGDTLQPPLLLQAQYRTQLDVGGDSPVAIRYDPLGIGRLANRTLRVMRGDAMARITVSAYGRVRAW